jgi:Arc/MetJ family transcription regulator
VFYPDGTATDARLVLTNERAFVELQLRGLTGFSRASELLAQEELAP